MAGARKDIYGAALEELMAAPECDAVVAVVGSSAQFHPEVAVEPILDAGRIAAKPLAAFLVPQADRSLELLGAAGIAAFRTPEACADALRACLDGKPPAATPAPTRDLAAVEAALGRAAGPVLDELAAREIFAALGVPQAEVRRIDGPGEGAGITYPVAAKILSADIAHKTEAGGVELDIADAAALDAACARILANVGAAHPEAKLDGILVQRMETGLAEILVGYRDNEETGPVVMVGVGGVMAEIHRDVAIRMAPVDAATAREMIDEVAGLAPLRGYRGLPEGDCAALADAVAALSDLARLDGNPVAEAEINPLIVRKAGAGVVAVDGLVVMA